MILEILILIGFVALRANLVPVTLQIFNIILGVDGLSKYQVVMNCQKETMKFIRTSNFNFPSNSSSLVYLSQVQITKLRSLEEILMYFIISKF